MKFCDVERLEKAWEVGDTNAVRNTLSSIDASAISKKLLESSNPQDALTAAYLITVLINIYLSTEQFRAFTSLLQQIADVRGSVAGVSEVLADHIVQVMLSPEFQHFLGPGAEVPLRTFLRGGFLRNNVPPSKVAELTFNVLSALASKKG